MILSDRAALVQSFLFVEGGSLSRKKLAQLIGCTEADLPAAIAELKTALEGTGLAIIETEREVALTTAPRVSEIIKAKFEESLQRDIGDAGLEVLAVLLYRGPSTRSQIDYIRGVNTSSTIRTLLSRGLLERTGNPDDAREYLYRPTTELLAHLGASGANELPDYATIRSELSAFEDKFEHRSGPFADDAEKNDRQDGSQHGGHDRDSQLS